MNPDRLGVIDETYLRIENARMPLHVASIGIFEADGLCDDEGRLRLEHLRARIESRLDALPRLRQRVVEVPLGLHRPQWIDDEAFDIAHHVDAVALPAPHDEAALLDYVDDLVMQPLDRRHPLWHLRFITGLDGDRVVLVERAHHAMIDGVSGVDISLVILDATPDEPDHPAPFWKARPTPSPGELTTQALLERATAPVEAAARGVQALASPARLAEGTSDVAGALTTLRNSGVLAPRCSINGPLGYARELIVDRVSMESLREAGAAHGATVNDVVLAAVAAGLRELFLGRREPLPTHRTVKVMIPVSLRRESEAATLGNRVGALLASLPVGIGDPEERLRAIASTTRGLKESREATTADLLLQTANLLPPSLVHVVQRGVDRQPLVNMVVTNIPGPDFPLYALGSRLLEAYPVVPLGASMTLEVAVLSYDGALHTCVIADRDACPDAAVFAEGFGRGFEELGAKRRAPFS